MSRVTPIELNRYFVHFFIVILFIVAAFPLAITADDMGTDSEADNHNGRSARVGDHIVGGNQVKTIRNVNYNNLWIKDNASVTIEGINEITGRLNVTNNAEVLVKKGSKITVGLLTANCKRFNMEGGVINCKNRTSYLAHGVPSYVLIHTKEGIEISSGAKISAEGLRGQQSTDSSKASFNGGEGLIELVSDKYIRIIENSELKSTGGTGGSGVEFLYIGGNGGNGIINLETNGANVTLDISIEINGSTIKANGGSGGGSGGGLGGAGGDGGAGEIHIISKSNKQIKIEKSRIESIGGNFGTGSGGGPNGFKGDAAVYFDCKTMFVDEYKNGDDQLVWFDSLTQDGPGTKIISDGSTNPYIEIKAPNDAYLYVVHIGDQTINNILPIAKGTGTIVHLYKILKVNVGDTGGTKIEGANVDCDLTGTKASDTTDSIGSVYFLLLSNKITPTDKEGEQGWSVTASITGASGSHDGKVFLPQLLNEIDVNITLVTVTITQIEFDRQKYTPIEGMIVYGMVTIHGTAGGPNAIASVTLEIGDDPVKSANDDSLDGNPYSSWSYNWNSTDVIGQPRRIKATATDGTFSDIDDANVIVGDSPVPPDLKIEAPINEILFKDYEGSSGIAIIGKTWDLNYGSTTLSHSKNVIEVTVSIKNKAGTKVWDAKLSGNNLKFNSTSLEYSWNTVWPTRNQNSITGAFEFPNGEYSIEVTAKDDSVPIGKTTLLKQTLTLHHVVKPTALIKDITATKNAKRVDVYNPDGVDSALVFKFESKKGENEVTIKIDLSDSFDPDNTDLDYYLDAGDGTEFKWVDNSTIENTYITSTPEDKVVINYRLRVKVRDEDNEESDKLIYNVEEFKSNEVKNLTVIIEFIPEDPPIGFGFLPFANWESRILFIVLLIIFNIAASIMIISKFKKINERRKAREAALDVAKAKQQEENNRKKLRVKRMIFILHLNSKKRHRKEKNMWQWPAQQVQLHYRAMKRSPQVPRSK
jgi:hypothetical protein